MDYESTEVYAGPRVAVRVLEGDDDNDSFAEDVREGLSAKPKWLAPKYFYDAPGSELFERICDLPEYYLTRTENSILDRYSQEIAEWMGEDAVLVELGSGSSTKTRHLIEALLRRHDELHYVPVDVSESILLTSARSLAEDYADLEITAYVAEYHTALRRLHEEDWHRKTIVFLGSNIGNFDSGAAERFLVLTRETMSEEDRLLMGVDLLKERRILEAAYNDAQGVTARFNLNILARINRELGGHFDLKTFRHRATFNERESRVEMHLESRILQNVPIDAISYTAHFERSETIHTENSYKYSIDQLRSLLHRTGFEIETMWQDERGWFSLNLVKPA